MRGYKYDRRTQYRCTTVDYHLATREYRRRGGRRASTLSAWFNYAATAKILIFGLLIGTALARLFAVGTVFAVLLVMVLAGVLFIAPDFIEHRIGWQWDDWGGWGAVFGDDEP